MYGIKLEEVWGGVKMLGITMTRFSRTTSPVIFGYDVVTQKLFSSKNNVQLSVSLPYSSGLDRETGAKFRHKSNLFQVP